MLCFFKGVASYSPMFIILASPRKGQVRHVPTMSSTSDLAASSSTAGPATIPLPKTRTRFFLSATRLILSSFSELVSEGVRLLAVRDL